MIKKALLFSLIFLCGATLLAQEIQSFRPYTLLNPPSDISPIKTRGEGESTPVFKPKQWTKSEHLLLEKKLLWFHNAKYGLFFHYLAPPECSSEKWNEMVNSIDVEKFADQVKETGAGYVIITIGQNQLYSCAPNPVLEKLWKLEPNTYTSTRDLPMEAGKALSKRGIKLMLYLNADNLYKLPCPKSFVKETDRFENWLKVLEWYSYHYGNLCSGWWIDGLNADWTSNYWSRVHETLKLGNQDAITASASYGLSEFTHGHCGAIWEDQQKYRKPYYGRWEPIYNIQWHVLQYLGSTWAMSDTISHSTLSLVNYSRDIIKGGGIITFDVGTYDSGSYYDTRLSWVNKTKKPTVSLSIPEGQMKQLIAIRDVLKDIKPSDGSGN